MTVHLFYNPDLVGQLASCGITARRQPAPGARPAGFVLEGRRVPAQAREAVTHVVAARGPVTITGPRQPTARPAQLALPASTTTPGPQSALELAEECTRLRRSNQILTDEVGRLRAEIERLTGASSPRSRETQDDDAVKRFALLELD